MNLMRIFAFPLLLLNLLAAAAYADELDMRSVGAAPPNTASGVIRPTNGLSMDQVMQQYGEPGSRLSAVGEPPITRWVYDRYTVYFEHNRVIHSVVHR